MNNIIEQAIVVRDQTALEQLVARFNTKQQARFYIERSGGNFRSYEQAHKQFYQSFRKVETTLAKYLKYQVLFREFLPNFIFAENQIVIVVGRDGLVANTAKYVDGRPIIGINPDPKRIDGKLCRFSPNQLDRICKTLSKRLQHLQVVRLAEASLQDGQRLLAFNDLFIGTKSHISARYQLQFQGKKENQSSSGIIVSTGAGATGWLSSIINMTNGINQLMGNRQRVRSFNLDLTSDKLAFVVREPFQSRSSEAGIVTGFIQSAEVLEIESQMPYGGVIFSDGIEQDFLHFHAGSRAQIRIAPEQVLLIQ